MNTMLRKSVLGVAGLAFAGPGWRRSTCVSAGERRVRGAVERRYRLDAAAASADAAAVRSMSPEQHVGLPAAGSRTNQEEPPDQR
ncbi:hypothetical protein ONA70_28880 [Micromonospora yasonensis]|uniref:hypothetical protein n=1 Tax=Micromonospora yasonensis TaxID=1128667 RepID=UPI00222E1AF9|nr:hypothetical protein [Micromonospora yasonensis]MCW3844112.1 hypothetical protein [Micromonospora yasonensis]